MKAKVILYSDKSNEISNFLNKFYSNNSEESNSTSWKKEFPNPVEITEFIAAFADNNFKIEKSVDNNYTKSSISLLDENGKVQEITRMLGLNPGAKSGEASAKELIESSEAFKNRL